MKMHACRIAIAGVCFAALCATGCGGQSGNAAAGSGMSGRVGSGGVDDAYGDVKSSRGGSTAVTGATGSATTNEKSGGATLPSLADEESRRAKREVERVANLARMTELVPSLKAPDWITAGKVVKGDQTIVPASGTGNSLKDAYDAAVISGQRELLKQAGIPAARVVIGRGAYQRMMDGQWQVFLETVGVGGTGPLPILATPANTEKPPVDLVGE